jgi:DNA-binding transcriptional MerR regulator/effector-binding domain-containing protein
MLSVGDLASSTGVTVRTLHHYDEIGLLPPTWVDPNTNYRYYESAQIGRLQRILALKELGFTLVQVRSIVDEQISPAELRGMLRLRQNDLSSQITDAQQRFVRAEHLIQRLEKEEREMNAIQAPVVRKNVPEMIFVELSAPIEGFGEHVGPVLGPLYPQLFAAVEEHALTPIGTPIAYYTEDAERAGYIVHAALPIAGATSANVAGNLKIVTLPAIDAAALVHYGTMATIGESYAMLVTWIEANNLRSVGFSREIYLDCPPDDQSRWVTELQFEVQPI